MICTERKLVPMEYEILYKFIVDGKEVLVPFDPPNKMTGLVLEEVAPEEGK